MATHQTPTERKKQILDVAIGQAREVGYQNVTRENIAKAAGISTGLVSKYFATMTQLKRALMRAAINQNELKILAQGLASNDPNAVKAPDELKKQAINALMS